MNFSEGFIKKPIATTLIMIALLIAGLFTYKNLPISALPDVDYPTIQVTTEFPGASPKIIEKLITSPLEKQLGQMSGLEQMISTSSAGVSLITLRFALNVEMSVAEQEVQAALNTASNSIPSELPSPPVYNKVNPADTPVITLAITSDTLPLHEVRDLVETRILQDLSQISGVGLVNVAGGQKPAYRIQVNPVLLANSGLTFADLRSAISQANINAPLGTLNSEQKSTVIHAQSQLQSVEDYENLIISFQNNSPLRLGQVAKVVRDAQNLYQSAWINNKQAILLNIQRQPSANVIDVVDEIYKVLPDLRASLPQTIDIQVVGDRTESIRLSIDNVKNELLLSIALVVIVTFIFLRSITATLIPSIVVPLSIIGTFIVMFFLGYSINNLTLMALTIATGFVVDDAIVMIENIARHVEEGDSPLNAALKGSKEIGFTLISLTFSLIAVLIPLLFMGDILGRLFSEFAITLAVAILISLFISLTLTPMMCARLLNDKNNIADTKQYKGFHGVTSKYIDGIISLYSKALDVVLRNQFITLLIALSTLGLTVFLYIYIPKGFFPEQDTGEIQIITTSDQSSSFIKMTRDINSLIDDLLKNPNVKSITSYVGVDNSNTSMNKARMQVSLKPHTQRGDLPAIIENLKTTTNQHPLLESFILPNQDLALDAVISQSRYQLTLSSIDAEELNKWISPFKNKLKDISGVRDVVDNLQNNGLELFININRDLASKMGISISQIDEALYNAYGQRLISTVFTQSNQYRVVIEIDPKFSTSPQDLKNIFIKSQTSGSLLKLTDLADIQMGKTTLEIQRVNQFPSVMISFNVNNGYALSDIIPQIMKIQSAIKMPASVYMNLQGSTKAYAYSQKNTIWLLLAAIFVMYIVLGVLYESFIHPITILSTLPSATIGALLALILVDRELDMVGIIGIILLIGIVKKNAIMVIDFALNEERVHGLKPIEAVKKAALLRFRPIFMTTLAALFAAIPLMFSTGVGAELRTPLGLTMVGGLMLSQILTLFTTPVIYLYFDRLVKSK
ncbi:efflux RND transporter permease subunit [Taylorella equigenitalis]|uniref:efflux RND transporter permease subunit n=1 Tax=Taylorella equigenitalis TaxID=29575 RepID=UPI0023AF9484|nr:efflux RND transporter permease subunit [Taylorella equigenitalis]WED99752.1 efflux RND transporter permease subunit [Taylorella equigenitalis]WEE01230.1 efflux RND transporter permease subunit [Taylorella equigenitalis]WFD77767.1 efflux RND transporter permease subunit [Taylorella equigenitalis]WFD79245.1 efflux RND transporter permease subunit [Taylorella equigenitalis]WFD99139.1 efflux RND transporter permease subunit [Taylorella equigenitalis]